MCRSSLFHDCVEITLPARVRAGQSSVRSLESCGASERFCSPDCNDKMNPTAMRWRAHVKAIAVVLVCSIPHQSNGCSSGCIKIVVLSKCASRYVFAFSAGVPVPRGGGQCFLEKLCKAKSLMQPQFYCC